MLAPATKPGTWKVLDPSEDVNVKAGYWYAFVAMVKNSHDTQAVRDLAAKYHLDLSDLQDPAAMPPPEDDSYRYVQGIGYAAVDGGDIPHKVPSPFSLFDGSRLVKAWTAPGAPNLPPEPPKASSGGGIPWMAIGALAGVGALVWLMWPKKDPPREVIVVEAKGE